MDVKKHSELIKNEAYRLGFDFVGIAKAERMDEEAKNLEKWLNQNMHGKMHYMEKNSYKLYLL